MHYDILKTHGWTARKLDDEKLLRSATTFNTFFLFWQGKFKDAVRDYEKSVLDVEKYHHARFPLLAAMTIGTCYGQIGQVTQGLGMIDSIRRLCLERGDTGLAAHSGTSIGAILLDMGRIDDALQYLEPSVEAATRVHRDWTMIQGELMLSYAYYLKGHGKRCIAYLRQFHKHNKQVHVSVRSWPYLMELCWAMENGHLPPIPEISIKNEIQQMLKGQNICLKGVAYRFKALLQKKESEPPKTIVQMLKRSIELLERSGQQIELAKSRLELARIYMLMKNQKKAVGTAQAALSVFHALNKSLIPDDLKSLTKTMPADDNLLKDILQLNTKLSSMDSGKERIQHIISTANQIIGAERGAILLLKKTNGAHDLHLRASKNLTSDQIDQVDFQASMNMITDVATRGKGQVQGGMRKKEIESPYGETILSRICAPIIQKDRIVGVMYHDNRLLSNAFSESQLEMLSAFAALAAMVHRTYRYNGKK